MNKNNEAGHNLINSTKGGSVNIHKIELFTLPSCVNCVPAKNNLMKEFPEHDIVIVDCNKSMDRAQSLGVVSTPTVIFHFDDGEEIMVQGKYEGFSEFISDKTKESPKREELLTQIQALKYELANIQPTKCEVYTRIVGYYRPVPNWNPGKKAEYDDRIEYGSNCG